MDTTRIRTFEADHAAMSELLDKAQRDDTTRRAVRDGHRLSIYRIYGGVAPLSGYAYVAQDGKIRREGDGIPTFEIAIDGTGAGYLAPILEGRWGIVMETVHVRLAAPIAAEAIEAVLLSLLAGAPLSDSSSAAFDAWQAEHAAGAPKRHAWLMGALAQA